MGGCAARPQADAAWALTPAPAPALAAELERALAFAEQQTANLYARLPDLASPQDDAYPDAVPFRGRQYRMTNPGHWGSGFFPATLWALYELTGRSEWKARAEAKTLGLWGEVVWDYGSNIGYKMIPFRQAHRLSGDPTFLSFILRGAATYVRSFGAELCVGSIPTWNPGARRVKGRPLQHGVHTGGLMNIELLFWAARQPGGDRAWHEVAHRHALNGVRDQLRPDGAAYHIVDYNPSCPPGGWRWRGTDSGLEDGIKARPHALAIYGFTAAYRATDDPVLLEAALRTAAFFLDHPRLPADGVPYTDLLYGPTSDQTRDSSAGALAASALLDLAALPAVKEGDRQRFRAAAERLLLSLATRYLARGQTEGILNRGTEPLQPSLSPNDSYPIGDFAFLDAVHKYLGEGLHCRAPICELEAEAGQLSAARVTSTQPPSIEPAAAEPEPAARLTPSASYRIRLPRPGRFLVRARVELSPAAGARRPAQMTFTAAGQTRPWTLPSTHGFQLVTLPGELPLPAGPQTLTLSGLPPGLRLDKLLLERR